MSRIPLFGAQDAGLPIDGTPISIRARSLFCWRASGGVLLPLNDGFSVAYQGRSAAATIYASDGTSGALVASAPAFSSVDWDGDSVRESDALELSTEEALRYYDAASSALRWPIGAQTWRLEWIERGAALVADAPYVTLSNNAGTGAYVGLFGTGDGRMILRHHNGTDTVESALTITTGQRGAAVAWLFADGAVQLALVRNGGTEAVGTKSAALTPAASWGGGSGVQLRLNEFGSSVRGLMALRWCQMASGILTRQSIEEML